MNFIDNIEIKNFKSIRHQKIEGCKRINVFIGYPNVGKSNILEALSLGCNFQNSNKPVSLKDVCRFEELIGMFNDGDKQRAIILTINNFVYVLLYVNKNQINYSVIPKNLFSEKIDPRRDSVLEFTIDDKGNFLDFTLDDNNAKIFGESKTLPSVKIKKYQFKSSDNKEENNPVKLDFPFGDNLFEVLRHNSELRKDCGELFSDYNLKLYFEKDNQLKITRQLDEFTIFPIPFSQIADTLQRLIFHKAAIATNQNTVLLFEEPEAHMFPPYISKFTKNILYDENNNQFFIATHSPYVLNDLMDNLKADELAIYIVSYKKDTGETQIHHMNEEDMHEAYQFGYDFFMNIDKFIPQEQHG